MAKLNVFAKFPDGSAAGDQLVQLDTAPTTNWFEAGMPIFPQHRRTSGDGGVNFYSGDPLPKALSVVASCQNGISEVLTFDGTVDVNIPLVVIPFG